MQCGQVSIGLWRLTFYRNRKRFTLLNLGQAQGLEPPYRPCKSSLPVPALSGLDVFVQSMELVIAQAGHLPRQVGEHFLEEGNQPTPEIPQESARQREGFASHHDGPQLLLRELYWSGFSS